MFIRYICIMKKIFIIFAFLTTTLGINAQKFALVDMEYILKNIPAYERANEQLTQVSNKWQAEVESLSTEAQTMYKNYQNEVVFLSAEQKKAKQDAIMQKEQAAAQLKQKYFGPEGELYKKRTALMTPIQDEILQRNQRGKLANRKNSHVVLRFDLCAYSSGIQGF